MLARHGYGVLLFDRRGEGESEGEPNSWGWGGDRDVEGRDRLPAAPAGRRPRPDRRHRPLRRRRDDARDRRRDRRARGRRVRRRRRAVVLGGHGSRRSRRCVEVDARRSSMSASKTVAVAVSSNQLPPANLKDLAADVEQPMLLIAAPNSAPGRAAQPRLRRRGRRLGDALGDPRVGPRRRPDGAAAGVRAARGRASSTRRWRR